MKAAYVAPKRTPLTFDAAAKTMKWALKCVLGHDPNDETLALALAKTALETGRWTQIWNDNWGNVKAGNDYAGMFTCITLNEVLKGKVVWFAPEGELTTAPSRGGKLVGSPIAVPDGHPQTRMRAFANEFNGAECYVDFVATHYPEAWTRLLAGDATGYVHALKARGYFTADEATYARGVVSLQREMLTRLHGLPKPPPVDLEWEKLVESVPGVQFDLVDMASHDWGCDFVEQQ